MKQLIFIFLLATFFSCTKKDEIPVDVQEGRANKSGLLVSKQYVNGVLQRQYTYKDGFIIYKHDENATHYYAYDIEKLQTITRTSVGSTTKAVHQFNKKRYLLYTDQYRNDIVYLRRVRFYKNNVCTGWMNVPYPGYEYFKTRTDYIYTTPWNYYTQVTDYNSEGNPTGTGIDEVFKWPTPFILEKYTSKNVLITREYFSTCVRRPDYNILNNPKPWPLETHESMSKLMYDRSEPHPDSRPGLLVMKTEHFSGGILTGKTKVENLEMNRFGLPTKYDLVSRTPDGHFIAKDTYQIEYIKY
jgi:hypothetical protein